MHRWVAIKIAAAEIILNGTELSRDGHERVHPEETVTIYSRRRRRHISSLTFSSSLSSSSFFFFSSFFISSSSLA